MKIPTLQTPWQLWTDERGAVSVFSIILLTTILCLGSIAGLGAIRDHVAQEFGDVAVALDNVDQSFRAVIFVEGHGGNSELPACYYAYYVDDPATLRDPAGAPPACLNLSTPPAGENGVVPTTKCKFP